jgi:hypothetical protein
MLPFGKIHHGLCRTIALGLGLDPQDTGIRRTLRTQCGAGDDAAVERDLHLLRAHADHVDRHPGEPRLERLHLLLRVGEGAFESVRLVGLHALANDRSIDLVGLHESALSGSSARQQHEKTRRAHQVVGAFEAVGGRVVVAVF